MPDHTVRWDFLWVTGERIPVRVCCLEFYLSRSVADPSAEDDCCRADGLVPESGTGDAN